jgi:predicted permease
MELEARLDAPVLLFTAGTALLAALVFGLAPALEAMRAPVAATLRDEAGSSGGRRKVGARGLLVASQMTLSTILLFGAGLFMRSLQAATETDLGFSTRSAAVVKLETSGNEYTDEQAAAFVDDLERRVAARPGIEHVAVITRMPLQLGNWLLSFDVPGVEPPPNQSRHRLEYAAVSDGYFAAMGIEIVEGRPIDATDRAGSQRATVLSREAAERFWPGESAIGKLLILNRDGSDALTVVGVADDVKIWSLGEAPRPYMYVSYFQGFEGLDFAVVARGNAAPGEVAAAVRDEARAIDPDVLIAEVGTMDDHLGYIFFLPRMAAVMLSLVGLLALTLACLGLYGMVSYSVARRTREMGIRVALGADRQSVIGLVLGGGLALVGVGAVLGIVLSVGLGRAVERFLIGVGGLDLVTLLAAPLLLAGVAALATYLPARRASRVDPVQALRSE